MSAAPNTCPCGAPAGAGGVCDACFARGCVELGERFPSKGAAPRAPGLVEPPKALGERVQAQADARRQRADETERALAASPHPCADGCGVRVLHAGAVCNECAERQRRVRVRQRTLAATLETVPVRYRWCSYDAPDLTKRVLDRAAATKARAAIVGGADRLLFTGDGAGVGKTVLATCSLLAAAATRGLRGRFIEAQSLAMTRALARLGAEPDVVVSAFEVDALVLDELGADKPVHSSPIAEILHRRHADMKLTIVTTGLTLDQLAEKYGDGIARRLTEGAVEIHVRRTAAPRGAPDARRP